MRERIALQSPVRTSDSYGEKTTSYVTVHEVWAQVVPLHGVERFTGNAADPSMSHRVLVRHEYPLEEVTPDWRVLWGTRTLGITSIANLAARDRIIEFLCREAR